MIFKSVNSDQNISCFAVYPLFNFVVASSKLFNLCFWQGQIQIVQKAPGSLPGQLAPRKREHIEGLSLEQPFPFASACGHPEFTNFTVGFVGCLDYIFYQMDHLAVEQIKALLL